MFYVSLFFSFILVLIAINAVYKSAKPIIAVAVTGLIIVVLPCGLGFFFQPIFELAIVLNIAAILCNLRGRHPGRFVAITLGSMALVYGIASWFAWANTTRLLGQFPYVSMEERLRLPQGPETLPTQTAAHLSSLEEKFEEHDPRFGYANPHRTKQLQSLHENTVKVFLNDSNFGVTRMMAVNEYWLKRGLRTEPPVPQPGPRTTPLVSTGDLHKELAPAAASKAGAELGETHENSLLDFVNRSGFGFFKDRRHVAGFQEHQVSQTPPAPQDWVLETVDLIGLVVHPEPVAYISEHLPRMDEIREAPTRLLDEFETNGLTALQRGDDLYVRDTLAGRRRALGSLRSIKQCLTCHGGERGALLGAFSYTLRPAKK